MLDFLDPFGNRQGRVERDDVVEIGRETVLQLGHQLARTVGGFQRVCSRHLVERDQRRRLAVETPLDAVRLGAELDARDIAYADQRAVAVRPQNDVAELLLTLQPALRAYCIGELLARRNGFGADRSCRIHRVLRVDRVDDLGNRDVQTSESVRPDP